MAEESKRKPDRGTAVKARVVALCAIIAGWLALDAATKAHFLAYPTNALVGGPYLGLFDFRIVHNTGGAWGVFSNSTVALGAFSLIVCAALAVYFAKTVREQGWLATVGIALIIAGGVGNALDRFARGFVMDFIEFGFFDFPVFNVADIGVTCGFVLLILGLLICGVREAPGGGGAVPDKAEGAVAAPADGAGAIETAADEGAAESADEKVAATPEERSAAPADGAGAAELTSSKDSGAQAASGGSAPEDGADHHESAGGR